MRFLGKIFKNKSIVTIVALSACLIILFFAYRYRVNTAINAVSVPMATKTLYAREEITEDSFKTVKVASSMIAKNIITNKEFLIGKFVNYNTFIPEGSMFYSSAVVTWDQMPDSAWSIIQEGYTMVSLNVSSMDTYGNSIYPGDKIDLYLEGNMDKKYFIGPLITGIEVLAVKDEHGNHIFKKSSEQKAADELVFAVKDQDDHDQYAMFRKAKAIFGEGSFIVVPRNSNYNPDNVNISQGEIFKYLNSKANYQLPNTSNNIIVDDNINVTE